MADQGAQGPSTWDLVLRMLEEIRGSMLTRDQWAEAQRGADRRFETLENRQAAWEAKSEAAHAELHERLDAERRDRETAEKAGREGRQRTWLAIGVVGVGIVGTRVWEVLTTTGATP